MDLKPTCCSICRRSATYSGLQLFTNPCYQHAICGRCLPEMMESNPQCPMCNAEFRGQFRLSEPTSQPTSTGGASLRGNNALTLLREANRHMKEQISQARDREMKLETLLQEKTSELDALRAKCERQAAARQAPEKDTSELQQLRLRVNTMQSELEKRRTMVSTLRMKAEDSSKEAEDLKKSLSATQQQLVTAQADLKKLRGQFSAARNEREELQNDIARLCTEREATTSMTSALREENRRLEKELSNRSEMAGSELQALTTEINNIKTLLETSTREVARLREQNTALDTSVSHLAEELDKMTKKDVANQGVIERLRQYSQKLEADVESQAAAKKAAEDALEEKKADRSRLLDRVNEMITERNELKLQCDALEEDLASKTKICDDRGTQLEALRNKLEDTEAASRRSTEEKTKDREVMAVLQGERNEALKKAKVLEEKVVALESALKTAEEEHKEFVTKLSLEDDGSAQNPDMDRVGILKKELLRKESENVKMSKDLQELCQVRNQCVGLQHKISELEAEQSSAKLKAETEKTEILASCTEAQETASCLKIENEQLLDRIQKLSETLSVQTERLRTITQEYEALKEKSGKRMSWSVPLSWGKKKEESPQAPVPPAAVPRQSTHHNYHNHHNHPSSADGRTQHQHIHEAHQSHTYQEPHVPPHLHLQQNQYRHHSGQSLRREQRSHPQGQAPITDARKFPTQEEQYSRLMQKAQCQQQLQQSHPPQKVPHPQTSGNPTPNALRPDTTEPQSLLHPSQPSEESARGRLPQPALDQPPPPSPAVVPVHTGPPCAIAPGVDPAASLNAGTAPQTTSSNPVLSPPAETVAASFFLEESDHTHAVSCTDTADTSHLPANGKSVAPTVNVATGVAAVKPVSSTYVPPPAAAASPQQETSTTLSGREEFVAPLALVASAPSGPSLPSAPPTVHDGQPQHDRMQQSLPGHSPQVTKQHPTESPKTGASGLLLGMKDALFSFSNSPKDRAAAERAAQAKALADSWSQPRPPRPSTATALSPALTPSESAPPVSAPPVSAPPVPAPHLTAPCRPNGSASPSMPTTCSPSDLLAPSESAPAMNAGDSHQATSQHELPLKASIDASLSPGTTVPPLTQQAPKLSPQRIRPAKPMKQPMKQQKENAAPASSPSEFFLALSKANKGPRSQIPNISSAPSNVIAATEAAPNGAGKQPKLRSVTNDNSGDAGSVPNPSGTDTSSSCPATSSHEQRSDSVSSQSSDDGTTSSDSTSTGSSTSGSDISSGSSSTSQIDDEASNDVTVDFKS